MNAPTVETIIAVQPIVIVVVGLMAREMMAVSYPPTCPVLWGAMGTLGHPHYLPKTQWSAYCSSMPTFIAHMVSI